MLLDGEVSLARKARRRSWRCGSSRHLSKDRILELYLNEIYLGLGVIWRGRGRAGLFQQAAGRADHAEAAFLAALPKAPNNYNPFTFPDAARPGATGCWTAWPRTA